MFITVFTSINDLLKHICPGCCELFFICFKAVHVSESVILTIKVAITNFDIVR